MKRITPEVKAIADAHIKSRLSRQFSEPVPQVKDRAELLQLMRDGYTFEPVVDEIERRFVSVTSLIYQRAFEHTTDAYKKAMYKAFRILFS